MMRGAELYRDFVPQSEDLYSSYWALVREEVK